MKKRYLYALLFATPGFFISLIVSFILFSAVAGFLWIYLFGDASWPASAGKIISPLFILTFLAAWAALIVIGFITGKKLEEAPALDTKHVFISVVSTTALILFIILHQLVIGNIGPQSDSIICSEFCRDKGYPASGMPPRNSGERTCSCFDNNGQEIIKVMMENINSRK